MPIGVIVLAVVAVVCHLMLTRTAFGRWLYASGGNERAAELSGVPTKRVKITVYVLSGICAAIAGLVLSSQLTSAGPTAGTTYELTAIAAVVIGGAALTGGRGTVGGTMLGAFVIGFLSDGLVIVGVSAYWQTVFTGAVIVLAVLLNSIQYGAAQGGPDREPRERRGSTAARPTPPKGERLQMLKTRKAPAAGRRRRHPAPRRLGLGRGADLDHRHRPVEPLLADRGQGRRGDRQGARLHGQRQRPQGRHQHRDRT